MTVKEYEYNILDGDIIRIKEGIKEKKKDYGFISLPKGQVTILVDSINLMSSSPNISSKFSAKIGPYLVPRFNEILGIISMNEALPDMLNIEMSKKTQKEMIKGLSLPTVVAHLKSKGSDYGSLIGNLKEIKMTAFDDK